MALEGCGPLPVSAKSSTNWRLRSLPSHTSCNETNETNQDSPTVWGIDDSLANTIIVILSVLSCFDDNCCQDNTSVYGAGLATGNENGLMMEVSAEATRDSQPNPLP